jgi:phenylalanyl-tRNA synthetase alpha chain
MFDQIEKIQAEIEAFQVDSKESLEQFKREFVGAKNKIKDLFKGIKEVENERKKEFGQKVNDLKNLAESKFAELNNSFEQQANTDAASGIDLTRPGQPIELGSRHPITLVQNQIINIFNRIGYNISEGPEIEDDWHNFTALNLPEDHPARDMQDTYFLETDPDMVLRTHTSSVQVRVMENEKPPIRTISPGRVYRNEAISARSHCQFHQVEGLYIDKDVSFADLKQTLYFFVQELFGEGTKIRFRPSYFPFTEPSAEMDISCPFCTGDGCNICKKTGWVEIGGCGMVDPAVLTNAKIDPEEYSGFAFGMGVERITMLKYQVNDIRLFFENDVRFLRQFNSVL